MLDFGFYLGDCMDYMKDFPDNYFNLAIIDPPYGDGGGTWLRTDKQRFGGRFDKYKPQKENGGGVAQYTYNVKTSENQMEHGVTRTGGTWAAKYTKKSWRGTLPRRKSSSRNCFVSHAIRLFGAATTSYFHRQDAFLFGEN